MKKKYGVCAAFLVCLIVLSVLLSACLTKEVAPLPDRELGLVGKGNTITTSVRLSELDYDRIWKLFTFYHYDNLTDFRYNEVFRNASLPAYDLYWILSGVPVYGIADDGRGTRLRAVRYWQSGEEEEETYNWVVAGDYKRAEVLNEEEKRDVVFFDGRKKFSLADDEIVVSKYAYLTLYVDQYGLEIDEETTYRIIDDEDVFAKYVILRNCPRMGESFYIDGVAMEYYGLDQLVEYKPLTLSATYYALDKKGVYREFLTTKKVVGYYNVDCSDLAGHKTDINNVFGYNVDAYRSRDLYEIIFANDEPGKKKARFAWFVQVVIANPHLSEDETMVTFSEPYGILNYEVDREILALKETGYNIKNLEGIYKTKMEKANYFYGN